MQIDTTLQQIKDLLLGGNTKKILVTSGKNVDPDAVGSTLAIAQALKNAQPELDITMAIEEYEPARYAFMPGADQIKSIVAQKSLVVSIDVSANPIEKINYNAEDTTFNFILTPKSGQVNVDQIQYSYAGLTYDTIIIVDTANKKLLGQWAIDFATELQETPTINIDHHADNDQFGSLNLVDSVSPSATIVIQELLTNLKLVITPDIATNLLAGIMSDTSGFANSNSNAASMRYAADLVDQGANLSAIMHGLFRTYSLNAIHLWGHVMSNVKVEEPGIVIATVSQEDISSLGAADDDVQTLATMVNNFLTAIPDTKVAVLLKDKGENEVSGSLRSMSSQIDVSAIAREFGGGGHRAAAGLRLTNTTLDQASQQVLAAIKNYLTSTTSSAELSGNPPQEEAKQG